MALWNNIYLWVGSSSLFYNVAYGIAADINTTQKVSPPWII